MQMLSSSAGGAAAPSFTGVVPHLQSYKSFCPDAPIPAVVQGTLQTHPMVVTAIRCANPACGRKMGLGNLKCEACDGTDLKVIDLVVVLFMFGYPIGLEADYADGAAKYDADNRDSDDLELYDMGCLQHLKPKPMKSGNYN
ncbi:hypothetical protein GPECTOR_11g12 [Gonium pectorale]|uniref:Uncharacterized protein n=1 Tax=Gonium pectorale TaxID=33097 RepID=A0A150GPB4_GONPE|nr:hypothetical protein GPECTOR_11g12 [Gonium pectorale]|eukprot:KXZ51667.1 hypothetical protein GPECTOR_11g12 [Gonium pectorale]